MSSERKPKMLFGVKEMFEIKQKKYFENDLWESLCNIVMNSVIA